MDNKNNKMDMMQMMMSGGNMPEMMQKCMNNMERMTETVGKSAELGAYATPELRRMFEEWMDLTSRNLLEELEKTSNVEDLSTKLGLSEQSINVLLLRLASMGKIQVDIKKA